MTILKNCAKLTSNCSRYLWIKRKINFGNYNVVHPGIVSPRKLLPEHIIKPSYYESGNPLPSISMPDIKTLAQITKMRRSCKLAANILNEAGKHIEVGQTTDEIDTFIHNRIIVNGAYPSPLNYKQFPKSVCTSVNNVACHGIPDDRCLENGDIINIDITVFLDGYHGDCSATFCIGDVDEEGHRLVQVTKDCLHEGIAVCKPGIPFSAIGASIEKLAKQAGYRVVPNFIGHGIGEYFHGPPDIYHCRNRFPGIMQTGMTFTIEPLLSQGGINFQILSDNWTATMNDDARTAQFEHTVLITRDSVEILTCPD